MEKTREMEAMLRKNTARSVVGKDRQDEMSSNERSRSIVGRICREVCVALLRPKEGDLSSSANSEPVTRNSGLGLSFEVVQLLVAKRRSASWTEFCHPASDLNPVLRFSSDSCWISFAADFPLLCIQCFLQTGDFVNSTQNLET